jgi:hypothetical protein
MGFDLSQNSLTPCFGDNAMIHHLRRSTFALSLNRQRLNPYAKNNFCGSAFFGNCFFLQSYDCFCFLSLQLEA